MSSLPPHHLPPVWEFSLADAGVIVRVDSLDIYALNSSAFYAWNLLKSAKSLEDASEDYSFRYGISVASAKQDLQRTWSEWQQGLLASYVDEASDEGPTRPSIPRTGFTCYVAHYRFCGRTMRVTLNDALLIDEIAPRLTSVACEALLEPDLFFEVIVSDLGYHIYVNSSQIAVESDLSEARIRFLREFVRQAMPASKWLATFHAAACGEQGRCMLLPAASHSGKTTLAAALMHAGLTLYAEDTAILQAEALTVPSTPFSLMIREGSWPVLMPCFPELAEAPVVSHSGTDVRFLAPQWDGEAGCAPVSAIVFSRYQPGCVTELQPLDTFETLVRLQASGFWVEHDRESIAEFLGWLASKPAYSLDYSNSDEAVIIFQKVLLSEINPSDCPQLNSNSLSAGQN